MHLHARIDPACICEQCNATCGVALFTHVSILYHFSSFSSVHSVLSLSLKDSFFFFFSARVLCARFSGFSSPAEASGFRRGRRHPSSSCSIDDTFRQGRLHHLLVPLGLLCQLWRLWSEQRERERQKFHPSKKNSSRRRKQKEMEISHPI
jgi:hypothetical protein